MEHLGYTYSNIPTIIMFQYSNIYIIIYIYIPSDFLKLKPPFLLIQLLYFFSFWFTKSLPGWGPMPWPHPRFYWSTAAAKKRCLGKQSTRDGHLKQCEAHSVDMFSPWKMLCSWNSIQCEAHRNSGCCSPCCFNVVSTWKQCGKSTAEGLSCFQTPPFFA